MCARLHRAEAEGDGAGIGKQQFSGFGQHRVTRGAVEQRDAHLAFQVGDGLADDRLRAVQTPSRRGKAAFLGGGDEHTELVQGDAVEHWAVHRLFRWYLS